jgi:hypothetical protein
MIPFSPVRFVFRALEAALLFAVAASGVAQLPAFPGAGAGA